MYTDSKTSKETLNSYIKQANFITINCPITKQNYHMIGKEQFDLMNSVIIINTARGGIIDEAELINTLNNKNVKFAAFDVLENEPPKANNPSHSMNHRRINTNIK